MSGTEAAGFAVLSGVLAAAEAEALVVYLPMRTRLDVPGWGPWSVKGGVLHALAPAEALMGLVALRVHLDDSTSANGPLRVLPGTHRMGVLGSARIEQAARAIGPVECVVGKGGVVLMRPLLVHASSKAAAVSPRRVLHIEYATSSGFDDGLELNTGPFAP